MNANQISVSPTLLARYRYNVEKQIRICNFSFYITKINYIYRRFFSVSEDLERLIKNRFYQEYGASE